MKIIGLGHKARQGKNLVAKIIVKELGSKGVYAKDYAFADALRSVCRVQFGMKNKDPRLLQLVGTEIFRKMNQDIWVDTLSWKIDEDRPDVAIITDVRFPNEAQYVKASCGILIKVERFTLIGERYYAGDRDLTHESETALDNYPWNYILQNHELKIPDLTAEIRQFLLAVLWPSGWVNEQHLSK